LDLSGSTFNGHHASLASTTKQAAIWLSNAQIGGKLLCVGTKIYAAGHRAIHADGIRVAGTVRLIEGFAASGQVRLLGAEFSGSLDLTGIHLDEPIDGLALDLGDARIAGGLFVVPAPDGSTPRIQGQLDMGGARIGGQCLFRAVRVHANPVSPPRPGFPSRRVYGSAISAPRVVVANDITFEGDCQIEGGIDLSLCEVSDIWIDGTTRLLSPSAIALDLSSAQLLGTLKLKSGCEVQGRMNLTSARIGGRLGLTGTIWSEPLRGLAVNAPSLVLEGDLDGGSMACADAGLNFRSAKIGGNVDLEGSKFRDVEGSYWLNLSHAAIGGSVKLGGGLEARGILRIERSSIAANLDLAGGVFLPARSTNQEAPGSRGEPEVSDASGSLRMRGLFVSGKLGLRGSQVGGSIDLADASVGLLSDEITTWPARYTIAGFVYGRFDEADASSVDAWDCSSRIDWVRGQRFFDAGSFEQLAAVYKKHGRAAQAEKVLIAQRREVWSSPTLQMNATGWARAAARLRMVSTRLVGELIGYGYRPGRVVYILAVLTAALGMLLAQPAVQLEMRSVDPQGSVYTVAGPLNDEPTSTTPHREAKVSMPCGDGRVRCFNPAAYAFETVIPLVSLGQRSSWYVNEETRRGRFISAGLMACSVFGWVLSSIFVLAFTRAARF